MGKNNTTKKGKQKEPIPTVPASAPPPPPLPPPPPPAVSSPPVAHHIQFPSATADTIEEREQAEGLSGEVHYHARFRDHLEADDHFPQVTSLKAQRSHGKMSIALRMAGRPIHPEIVMVIWMMVAGKPASFKHLCPHYLLQRRRKLVEEGTIQSCTILNSHRTTIVPMQGPTRVQQLATGVMQNRNIPKISGLLKLKNGRRRRRRKRKSGVTRRMALDGRQVTGGIIIMANGANNLTRRHGITLCLRIPPIPEKRRMHRPVDGRAGERRRKDYAR